MKIIKHAFTLAFIVLVVNIKAQNTLTIATDPVSVVTINGYEAELGFNKEKNRFALSYLSGDLPPWFGQATDFESSTHSVLELSYSRFLNAEQKGLSLGLAAAYFSEFSVTDSLAQSLDKNPAKLSLKLAYAWYPFEKVNLYIEPIMTFGVFISDEDLNFDSGEVFDKLSLIGNGPLFNIGYKFNLSSE